MHPQKVQVFLVKSEKKNNTKSKKGTQKGTFSILVEMTRFDRLLRLRLAYYSLGDPIFTKFGTRLTALC